MRYLKQPTGVYGILAAECAAIAPNDCWVTITVETMMGRAAVRVPCDSLDQAKDFVRRIAEEGVEFYEDQVLDTAGYVWQTSSAQG